jgi:hypothetical protein
MASKLGMPSAATPQAAGTAAWLLLQHLDALR